MQHKVQPDKLKEWDDVLSNTANGVQSLLTMIKEQKLENSSRAAWTVGEIIHATTLSRAANEALLVIKDSQKTLSSATPISIEDNSSDSWGRKDPKVTSLQEIEFSIGALKEKTREIDELVSGNKAKAPNELFHILDDVVCRAEIGIDLRTIWNEVLQPLPDRTA